MISIQTGRQEATIKKNHVCMDGKQQLYINLVLGFEDCENTLYTRIYITPKSAGIARASLKKCGFILNEDCNNLDDIDMNETFLAGKKVIVDVVENGKYLNASIVVEREKAPKSALQAAKEMLRNAKKGDGADYPSESPEDANIPF